MILQKKIQKKAEGYGKLAPAFLEGAKFALENQWISVKDDLPCNHMELVCGTEVSEGTKTTQVLALFIRYDGIWGNYMVYRNGKWMWDGPEPDFWTPTPKISKNRR